MRQSCENGDAVGWPPRRSTALFSIQTCLGTFSAWLRPYLPAWCAVVLRRGATAIWSRPSPSTLRGVVSTTPARHELRGKEQPRQAPLCDREVKGASPKKSEKNPGCSAAKAKKGKAWARACLRLRLSLWASGLTLTAAVQLYRASLIGTATACCRPKRAAVVQWCTGSRALKSSRLWRICPETTSLFCGWCASRQCGPHQQKVLIEGRLEKIDGSPSARESSLGSIW